MQEFYRRSFISREISKLRRLPPEYFIALHGLFMFFGLSPDVSTRELAVIFLPSVLVYGEVGDFWDAGLNTVQPFVEP